MMPVTEDWARRSHQRMPVAEDRQCAWCGGDMSGKQSSALYCSVACRDAFHYAVNRETIAVRHAAYRAANRETIAAYSAAYDAANSEKVAVRKADHYAANREAIAVRHADHYAAHPEASVVRCDRRRARKLGATCTEHEVCEAGLIREAAELLRIITPECWMCLTRPATHIEHLWPLVIPGGPGECIENIAWACGPCNSWKGTTLFSFIEELFT